MQPSDCDDAAQPWQLAFDRRLGPVARKHSHGRRNVTGEARERGDHLLVAAARKIGSSVRPGEEDVTREQEAQPLLVEADRSLAVAGQMQDVEGEVADAKLFTFAEVPGRDAGFSLEPVVVPTVEPIRVVGMDGERCTGRAHQRPVVKDVVDVAVRVGDDVQPKAVLGEGVHQRIGRAHAGVEYERVRRATVPHEVGVRLPRTEDADLDADGVPRSAAGVPNDSTTVVVGVTARDRRPAR